FVRNPDGSYSYYGDEGQRKLQVAGSTTVAINDNGKRLFEDVTNANRIIREGGVNNPALAGQVPPLPGTSIAPVPADEQRVFMAAGLAEDNDDCNSRFRAGEPYSLVFVSGSEFRLYDGSGADITSEIQGGGKIDPLASGGNSIHFRGMRFQLDVVLKEDDNPMDLDNLLANTATPGAPGAATHSFTLQSAPTEFAVTRSATNASTAVIGAGQVTTPATFNAQFPTSGVVLRYNGADFDVYALPYRDGNPVLTTAPINAGPPATIDVFGATFGVNCTPAAVAEFNLQPQFQEQRSILNTVARLRQALEGSPAT